MEYNRTAQCSSNLFQPNYRKASPSSGAFRVLKVCCSSHYRTVFPMASARSAFAPALLARVLQRLRIALRYSRRDQLVDFPFHPTNGALPDRHRLRKRAAPHALIDLGSVPAGAAFYFRQAQQNIGHRFSRNFLRKFRRLYKICKPILLKTEMSTKIRLNKQRERKLSALPRFRVTRAAVSLHGNIRSVADETLSFFKGRSGTYSRLPSVI
jgi:hypothetical protein